MNVKNLLFILGVAFFMVLGFFYFQKEVKEPAMQKLKEQERSVSKLYNFDTDVQTQYKLNFKQDSAILTSTLLPGKLSYGFEVDAVLNMRVLQNHKDFYWLAYQLSEFELHGEGVTSMMYEKLTPYYTSMFLVKIDKFANILEMHFGAQDINVAGLSQLLSTLEVINRNEKAYHEQQKDSIGIYEAFYRKDGNLIKKQKTKYIDVQTPDTRYSVKVKKFVLLAEVDVDRNWLKSFALDESLLIRDENNAPYAKNTNIVNLQKIDADVERSLQIWKETRDIESLLKEFKKMKKDDTNVFEIIMDENDKRKFIDAHVTIDTLIQKLKMQPQNGNNYREIQKYIRLFPDTTSKLKPFILDAQENQSLRLLAILSLVGTSQAQELLGEIATSQDTSHMNNIRAIIGLGGTTEATQNSINTLVDISDTRGDDDEVDKSNTSLLALGAHAKSCDAQNEEILSYIRSQYMSEKSLDREKNILYSMQNAGAENFIPEIEQSLTSKSIKVRTIAIQTIGTIKDTTLRETLLNQQLLQQENTKLKELIKKLLKK